MEAYTIINRRTSHAAWTMAQSFAEAVARFGWTLADCSLISVKPEPSLMRTK